MSQAQLVLAEHCISRTSIGCTTRSGGGGQLKVRPVSWMGPAVNRRALDLSAALRARITAHKRLMVLNDEAHHLWDPDSAWNEAIRYLHNATSQNGGGVVAQLKICPATPKRQPGSAIQTHSCRHTPG